MPKSMLSLVMLSLAYAALTACGTKGPLYIPEQRYPQESTQETPEPTPQINPDITAPVEY